MPEQVAVAHVLAIATLRGPGSQTASFEGYAHGAAISFFEVDADPGSTVALHSHPYTETWIVRSG